MKSLYIMYFDLDYYPNEHWVATASAFDLDEAKHLILERDMQKDNPEATIEDVTEALSEWVEIPIQVSKQGTYFPKPVTHVITGNGEKTRSIEILIRKE